MSDFSNVFKQLRISAGMTQKELAQALKMSYSSISMYERGEREPDFEVLESIADYFNVDMNYLMGKSSIRNRFEMQNKLKNVSRLVPVLGYVRAGVPITAVEEILDYEEVSEEMARSGELFALRVKGNSMEPRIKEGDVIIVRCQSTFENGEVCVVLVNGDEATVKQVMHNDRGITLVAYNPAYAPRFFTHEEINTLPVSVIGKVIELRAKF